MTDLIEPVSEASFEALVGEGKKFKDPDALAKSKVEADSHINTLEQELADMRAELQGRLSMEELLSKVQTSAPTLETPIIPSNVRQTEHEDGLAPTVNFADEVRKVVDAERAKERRDANIERARSDLKTRFGADYNTKLKSIAESLEVSTSLLTDMAATSPAGFIKLIDSVSKPDQEVRIPQTTINPSAPSPQVFTAKTQAYYKNLRQSDPKTYWSKRTQAEMHREAVKQGTAFYS